MSLFDALKEKDNLYGLPLLQAGLTILANNRGNTAGAPAILSGFNTGLSSYQTMAKRANIRKLAEQMKDPPPPPSSGFQPAVPPRRDFTPVPREITDGFLPQKEQNFTPVTQQPNSMWPQKEQNFTPVPQEMQSAQTQLAGNYKPEIQEIRHPNAVDYQPPQGNANVYGGQAKMEILKQFILENMDETNAPQMLGLYQKMMPSYKQDSFIIKGAGGVPQRVLVNSNGESQVLPYHEFDKVEQVDTSSQLYYIDPYTGEPRATYKKGIPPEAELKAHTSMAIANAKNATQERIARQRGGTVATGGDGSAPKDFSNLKLTEAQAKATKLVPRMINANKMLAEMPHLTFGDNIAAALADTPFNQLSPMFSDKIQQYMPAIAAFVSGDKYDVSGAAITSEEWDKAKAMYIPLAGDSPEKLKQKAMNREVAIASAMSAAGPYAKERVASILEEAEKANGYSQQNNGSSSSNQNASNLRFNAKDYR